MPIYEYQCSACQHKMEAMQKISEAPLVACPACQQETLQKLVSAAGFQLKGGGWYVTDYSSKDKAKAKKSTNDSDALSSSTEKKTDSASGTSKTDTK